MGDQTLSALGRFVYGHSYAHYVQMYYPDQ